MAPMPEGEEGEIEGAEEAVEEEEEGEEEVWEEGRGKSRNANAAGIDEALLPHTQSSNHHPHSMLPLLP